jgi:hypothetical protein
VIGGTRRCRHVTPSYFHYYTIAIKSVLSQCTLHRHNVGLGLLPKSARRRHLFMRRPITAPLRQPATPNWSIYRFAGFRFLPHNYFLKNKDLAASPSWTVVFDAVIVIGVRILIGSVVVGPRVRRRAAFAPKQAICRALCPCLWV